MLFNLTFQIKRKYNEYIYTVRCIYSDVTISGLLLIVLDIVNNKA